MKRLNLKRKQERQRKERERKNEARKGKKKGLKRFSTVILSKLTDSGLVS
jgi:hypothetical protein